MRKQGIMRGEGMKQRAVYSLILFVLLPAAMEIGCGPATDRQRFEILLVELDQAGSLAERDALIEAFFSEVAYSGGFPIQEEGDVLFVVERPAWKQPPVRVSGDFNGWDPDANPLEPVSETDLYYGAIPAEAFGERSRYKFVFEEAGDGDWLADPNARRFDHDAFGEISIVRGGTGEGHLERYPDFAAILLGNERTLRLYIPPGYERAATATYPVLYMHDGQNLFDPAAFWGGWQLDENLDGLIAAGEVEPLIVVGMDNTMGRMDEYTHVEDEIDGTGTRYGGDAPAYLDFIVSDVKPFIDAQYRTRPGRGETGIFGSSLGGLVSLWAAFAHGDTFSRVGGMSSTLGWGSISLNEETVIEIAAEAPKFDGKLYLDSGGGVSGSCTDSDGDGIWDDNPTAGDNYCETLQMAYVLLDRGYIEGTDFLYVHDPGAPHSEAAWSARVPTAFRYLFPGYGTAKL